MSKEMKLNCPMCKNQFITKRRDKVWCSIGCSDRFREVKQSIDTNKSKHKMFLNPNFEYNLETNKFKIKGWIVD
jgi:ribosomal protein L37AE/L43A